MQLFRRQTRKVARRPGIRAKGNRRRMGTGDHRPTPELGLGPKGIRRRFGGMRRARIGNKSAPRRGWIRWGLEWGVRLGVVGTLVWGLLVAVREGYAYATTSPRFEVRGLIYEPTRHVDDIRLRTLLALSPGTNILALDLDALAAEVAQDAWVARASVVRVLPDSLEVRVEEHEPKAVLALEGRLFLVDAQGYPFKPLERGERGQLPVLTGFDELSRSGSPEVVREQLLRGLEAFTMYRSKHRPRLSEINIGKGSELTLYTAKTGTQLRIGRGEIQPALVRYDALRAALGDDAEKLALVHLDGGRAAGRVDRVVASFFAAKAPPALLARAENKVAQKSAAILEAVAKAESEAGGRSVNPGPRKRALPRHH